MGPNQARFTRRYTHEQQLALLEAVLIDGMRVSEAIRKAREGGLKDTPACDWGSYAYKIIKRERDTFEVESPLALRRAIDVELHHLAVNTMRQARRLNEKQKTGQDVDYETVRKAALALRTLKVDLDKPKPVKDPEPGPGRAQTGVLGELLDLAETNGAKTDG